MNELRWLLFSHFVIILFLLFVSIYFNNPGFLIGGLGGLLVGAIYGPKIIHRRARVNDRTIGGKGE